jgi:hypothetical protein
VAEYVEAQGEGDWLAAWRRAFLNAFSEHKPDKMPGPAELLGKPKPQQSTQDIIAQVRAMVTTK